MITNFNISYDEPSNDEWVKYLGKYMLNMGWIEFLTRLYIIGIEGHDQGKAKVSLKHRLDFLQSKFVSEDVQLVAWANNIFDVFEKHCTFRNSVAHSPLLMESVGDSGKVIGIFNATPDCPVNYGEVISLEELRARVDESASLARDLVKMQSTFFKEKPHETP